MIPRVVHQAVYTAINGRPGPVYIEFPADVLRINGEVNLEYFPPCLAIKTYPSI